MASCLRDQAHDESHERITEQVRPHRDEPGSRPARHEPGSRRPGSGSTWTAAPGT
jgi:hypothetical protein